MAGATRITTTDLNGAAPSDAATLYRGEVMHARLKPFGHRFSYRVFSLLIDLDRLDEAAAAARLFSVNRPGVVSFHESDHAAEAGESARGHADRLLAEAGLERRAARVLLLCYPRVLGYVFNPISVYFAYDQAGELVAMIYGVRNTFGQRHSYVACVEPGEKSAAGVRQERSKLFHVSPFIGMDARYHFRVLPPGKAVRLRILETEGGAPVLSAAFSGSAQPLGDPALATCLLKIPFMTWKIMLGIHWEALKLWLKGARFHSSPPAPPAASFQPRPAGLKAGGE
jgi:DUF1365 family protein